MAAPPSPSPSSSGSRSLSALGRWFRWRPPVWDEEARTAILEELFFEGPEWRPFLWRFGSLIVLSTMIAGLGLIGDSAAVVIGAMLVAPLMTPILAVAAAAVHGQVQRLLVSASVLVGGTGAAIATGWLVAALSPSSLTADELTGELLARTTPSLLDLGVAIAAGLAGGYVLTHPRAGSSLPGVAIAVALVPPLATVGISGQVGATSASQGALLLYLTNLAAIVLSAMVMMLATGFVPPDVRAAARGRVRVGLVVALAAVVGVAVPLTAYTLEVSRDQVFTRQVVAAVGEWDPTARIVSVVADLADDGGTVDVVMASNENAQPAWRLAESIAATTGAIVDVTVEYRLEVRDEATAG